MLKNYVVVALRTLGRHRGYTALTVLGLALGMAVCLLILTFAWEQKTYDRFHAQSDRIVRILSDRVHPSGEVTALAATPAPLAAALEREVPGVEATVRIGQIRAAAVRDGAAVGVTGLYAEPAFFDVFDFEAASGDGRAVLAEPGGLLLTPAAAERIFGDEDPVGQAVQLEGHGDFVVGGVLAEPPGPSHLQFEVLASFATLATSERRAELGDWNNSWRFATYLLLDDPATAERLAAVLPGLTEQQYAGQEERLDFHVQPLEAIALGPVLGNEIASYSVPAVMVLFLAALGLVVMLAAGFNYVSLSVARAMRRAREVGTRKALGARRGQVVLQFLCEAVLVALAATGLAALLLAWLIPAFNSLAFVQLMNVPLNPAHLLDPRLLGLFVLFGVSVGLLAGLYPAVRLARFDPMAALKGERAMRGFSGRRLRHGLIGAQFALALFFVITVALLVTQFRYLTHADYGFAQDDLLTVDLQGQDYGLLRAELLRYPEIAAVAATSKLPASGSTSRVELGRAGLDEPIAAFEYAVDPNFLGTLDLDLVAGRGFSAERASDTTRTVVLNEAAVQALGLGSAREAVGAVLRLGEPERPVEVVGVVRDYHYNTLLDPIDVLVLYDAPSSYRYAFVRAQPGALTAASDRLDAVWERLDPVHPIVSDRFEAQLNDGPLHRLFGAFNRMLAALAALAVAISLLGLLGMAAYHVETRVKEVGVRKVLGASRGAIVWLLSRDFVRLVGVATVLTVPLAWLLSRAWLQIFAVRVGVSPWLVGGCVALVGALALGIVASQTLRAATADPVRSLRYE